MLLCQGLRCGVQKVCYHTIQYFTRYLHHWLTVMHPFAENPPFSTHILLCPACKCGILHDFDVLLLEDVQRRALQIIVGNSPYAEACCMLGIQSLADRRSELCGTLFKQIVNNEFHSLHYLLPGKRDTHLISRLRSTTVQHIVRGQTDLKIRS